MVLPQLSLAPSCPNRWQPFTMTVEGAGFKALSLSLSSDGREGKECLRCLALPDLLSIVLPKHQWDKRLST